MDANECFDPIGWCDSDLLTILTEVLEAEDLESEDFALLLNGLQTYFCDAATGAFANTTAFVHGSGEFVVTRSGNNGAVKQIALKATVDTTTLSLAHVKIEEDAGEVASAQGYAYRRVGSTGFNSCGTRYITGSLRYWLCASATGSSISDAQAIANATSSGSAVGGSDQSTDVSVFVDAANIKEFNSTVSVSAMSFALSEATAAAEAFTSVYSNALVNVNSDANIQARYYSSCYYRRRVLDYCYRPCSFCGRVCKYKYICVPSYYWRSISASTFSGHVSQVQSKVEESFASAYASSLASIIVKMTIPAYYKNENGVDDTFMFPEEVDDIPIQVTSQCVATAA